MVKKHEKLKTVFPKGKKNKKRRRREMQDFCNLFKNMTPVGKGIEKKDIDILTKEFDKCLKK